jgi:hypothetical protein
MVHDHECVIIVGPRTKHQPEGVLWEALLGNGCGIHTFKATQKGDSH